MNRRELGKLLSASAVSAASSSQAVALTHPCNDRRMTFAEFKEVVWNSVELGVKFYDTRMSFGDADACKEEYKKMPNDVDEKWVAIFERNYENSLSMSFNPCNLEPTHQEHFAEKYHWCAFKAGYKAASIAASKGNTSIDEADFKEAMENTHKVFFRMAKMQAKQLKAPPNLGMLLNLCG